jgi:hypothetical protein
MPAKCESNFELAFSKHLHFLLQMPYRGFTNLPSPPVPPSRAIIPLRTFCSLVLTQSSFPYFIEPSKMLKSQLLVCLLC